MKNTKIKKRITIFIIALWLGVSILLWLLIPSMRKGPLGFGPPASMTTFQANDKSFSIAYPANWVAFDLPQGYHGDNEVVASISVSGQKFAIIKIARKSFPDRDIDEVVSWGQSRATLRTDYAAFPLLTLDNNKLQGFIQDYNWLHSSYDKILMRCQNVYVLADTIGYSLEFCSQEKDWHFLKDFFTEMQQSFSISGEN